MSWNLEEDFTEEYIDDDDGDLVRKNEKGELHSLYSPAIEYSNDIKVWYKNGQCHRLDGPAIEHSNGTKVWFYENKFYGNSNRDYTQEKFLEDLRNEGKITSSFHKKDFSTFQKTINTLSNRDDKYTWSFILIVYLSNGQVVQSTETGSGHISAFRSFYKWLYVNSDPYYTLFNSDGVHIISREKIDYITIKEIK